MSRVSFHSCSDFRGGEGVLVATTEASLPSFTTFHSFASKHTGVNLLDFSSRTRVALGCRGIQSLA